MRVLFVASYNKGYYAPFILEQAEALRRTGCDVDFFGVTGKGVSGYIKSLPAYRKKIREYAPEIIHAHYGLSGLFANLQRKVPVVTTYHGSDINESTVRPFSKLAIRMSSYNIFVSNKTIDLAHPRRNYVLIPCGVDLNELQLTDKGLARMRMGLDADRKYVLFSGAFDNAVKNYTLAKSAVDLLPEVMLLELKGYSREQVTMLMCAADAILLTSFSEGSPQVIKEAMACGCPVVSVDVGDVRELTDGIPGCYICESDAMSLSEGLKSSFRHARTDGRRRIVERDLSNDLLAAKLMDIYNSIR